MSFHPFESLARWVKALKRNSENSMDVTFTYCRFTVNNVHMYCKGDVSVYVIPYMRVHAYFNLCIVYNNIIQVHVIV